MAQKKYGMVIDLRRCTGCHACAVACKSEFGVRLGVFRTWVKYFEVGTYPATRRYFLPKLCNHCDNPPCVPACPVNATYKREDGIVLVDYDKCIGCGHCMKACPYDARFLQPDKKIVDKCTFCEHRVEQGLVPACVNTCQGRARVFGDLNDPQSEVSLLKAQQSIQVLRPEAGTGPEIHYIAPGIQVASK